MLGNYLGIFLKDGFYLIDFQQNQDLTESLYDFIENEIRTYDESKSRTLSDLLRNPRIEFNLFKTKSASKLVIIF